SGSAPSVNQALVATGSAAASWQGVILTAPSADQTIANNNLIISNNLTIGGTLTMNGLIVTYNGVTLAGGGMPCEVYQSLNTGLVANFNTGTPVTMFTPATAGMFKIDFFQAISTPGSSSSTFPSLTLGYTDAGGVARTAALVATSATNTTGVLGSGTATIYAGAGVPITITSASYASSGGTSMAYELAVTLELL